MRILIAPDSFKGSLTSIQVAEALAEGWRSVRPQDEISLAPLADGGEGTLEAVKAAGGWVRRSARVRDPLGRRIDAPWLLADDGRTAVLELAAASGLSRLASRELDPLGATTHGTGDLFLAALEAGVAHVVLGIGGSATTDGGRGIVEALGARVSVGPTPDAGGGPLAESDGGEVTQAGGGATSEARGWAMPEARRGATSEARGGAMPEARGGAMPEARRGPASGAGGRPVVDLEGLDPRLAGLSVEVACDVTNPLLGPRGAAATYGPQKGASPAQVRVLDARNAAWADALEAATGRAVRNEPGAGAAGGVGFAMLCLADRFGAFALRPGVELVMESVGFAARLAAAGLVITGEGRIDAQTAFGKTALGVARLAQAARIRCVAVGGGVEAAGVEVLGRFGVTVVPVWESPIPLDEAMAAGAAPLVACGARIARQVVPSSDDARSDDGIEVGR